MFDKPYDPHKTIQSILDDFKIDTDKLLALKPLDPKTKAFLVEYNKIVIDSFYRLSVVLSDTIKKKFM